MLRSVIDVAALAWLRRGLLATLIRADFAGRYRHSLLGLTWPFLHPLLMLALFSFVFGTVIGTRWGAAGSSPAGYGFMLFAGMVPFAFIVECAGGAVQLVHDHRAVARRSMFPIDLLAWMRIGTATIHLAASTAIWFIAFGMAHGVWRWEVLLVPVLLVPLMLQVLGFVWLAAGFGVYLKDVGPVVGMLLTAASFLSPLFYPITTFPAQYRPFVAWNPVTPVVAAFRGLYVEGRLPPLADWLVWAALSYLAAVVGLVTFRRLKRGFADVL